ncbi:type III polyketide synthase [Sporosarcina ureilytica]|uniref:Type III polyketide synthase n=1 Tax=Sporosarcina ureilytica TaxID=298596 RepID=A0A1D8JEA9_9BACL|nr:3-oxoacyl-[acyl-carrier-protein] synthase III C-terminal domain-containing protein [Sporosarcina ureilytica]AOV07054.1 type III polyketide synthase [Sporosarcina ureilytica]
MPTILSVNTVNPPFAIKQTDAVELTRTLFKDKFKNIERLLKVFDNGEINNRYLCMPIDWFKHEHDFEERNHLYIEHAVHFGVQAIQKCLEDNRLQRTIHPSEIDAIFYISSSGIATPSIEARIMNKLPFRDDTKRIPIWGLGCAGGAAGVSRAYEFCRAFPTANVLVLSIEFCSLTFQKEDYSKSNLVGASLFADGIACALISGEQSTIKTRHASPKIIGTASKFMPHSEGVMGWHVKNSGFHVIFSKSIPSIITKWLGPFVHEFLDDYELTNDDITHFIAHPGGKKVLEAYENALHFPPSKTNISREILSEHGNMSSPTILYVLERFIENEPASQDYGLMAALGPGFCGELLLLKWE